MAMVGTQEIPATRVIAGAMSGTSADGVDVAVTRLEGRGWSMSPCVLHHHHRPYPADLRQRIFAVRRNEPVSLPDLARLAREISLHYAAAVNEALVYLRMSGRDLAAVAAHGQTLYHSPPDTIQWLDPALVAAEVGCAVVSDFRRADCAAGGQGAPLVPFADYILFRHAERDRVVLNIGGIANVTMLPAAASIDAVRAFDTGPGNCISDHLVRCHDPAGPGYDEGGKLASRGVVLDPLADAVLAHPYFARVPPKSTDGPEMIEAFEAALARMPGRPPLEDLLATACHIAMAPVLKVARGRQVIASGGGVRNSAMMALLKAAGCEVLTTDDLGIRQESKEAWPLPCWPRRRWTLCPPTCPAPRGQAAPRCSGR
jgi:anhydro-N-acetylmuramic acid kinase